VCTDCHEAHEILAPSDPKSPIFKLNVPNTCGKCHQYVAATFKDSIHGKVLARGNWQAPGCTDCHGIHAIKSHIDPASPVAAQALARTTCGKCHEGVRLAQEFGTASGRLSTYLDSYHGMASRFGSKVVANCASCHGIHNILPSSDPASTVHKSNLAKTCGACHPGAGENFTIGAVHVDVRTTGGEIGARVIGWVRRFYLVLIFTVIGGMLVHNFIIWRHKALDRRRAIPRPVIRMSRNQRVQHFLLFSSFFALVFTGFALTYPESWLAWLLGSSETVRRLGHRIAAVVLLVVSVYHIIYLSTSQEGRETVRDLLPTPQDATDCLQTMRYYLGLSSDRPRHGRFSYPEKVEYWALVWGMIVMALTGLAAWFQVWVVRVLPHWSIDLALVIHFYEAVLATLAIVVWHFYQVIFDPDVYPLNWAFWDGRVSAEHIGPHAAPQQGATPPEPADPTGSAADRPQG
jgi:formate dehydrogenase gamma subunit